MHVWRGLLWNSFQNEQKRAKQIFAWSREAQKCSLRKYHNNHLKSFLGSQPAAHQKRKQSTGINFSFRHFRRYTIMPLTKWTFFSWFRCFYLNRFYVYITCLIVKTRLLRFFYVQWFLVHRWYPSSMRTGAPGFQLFLLTITLHFIDTMTCTDDLKIHEMTSGLGYSFHPFRIRIHALLHL